MGDLLCMSSLPPNGLNSDGNVEFKVGDEVICQNLVSPEKGMAKTAKKVVRVDDERKLLRVDNVESPIKFENARLKSSAVKHLPKTSAEGVAFKEGDKVICKNLLNPDKGHVKSAKKIVRVDEERKLLCVDKVKSPVKFENAKLELPSSSSSSKTKKAQAMDVSASNPFTGSPLAKQNLALKFAQEKQDDEKKLKESKHNALTFAAMEEAKNLIAPFSRMGSKKNLTKQGMSELFPQHRLHVEPFVGGGSVFFNKEPSEFSVTNDSDETMFRLFHLLKTSEVPFAMPDIGTEAKAQKLAEDKPPQHEFVWRLLSNKFTFNDSGRGKLCRCTEPTCLERLNSLLPCFQSLLRTTEAENSDWEKVVLKCDAKDAFFHLDPPCDNQNCHSQKTTDLEHMVQVLKGTKGKFIASMNDTDFAREVFKDFCIKESFCVRHSPSKGERKELLAFDHEPV
mmetsp:Transcript_40162/g.67263  ORF Transcript_40162/g.67263 Transcript_40162/m.67263 type:complete len:452 (+) Transcript_40162:261-1616(+)